MIRFWFSGVSVHFILSLAEWEFSTGDFCHPIVEHLQTAQDSHEYKDWEKSFDETTTRPSSGLRMPLSDKQLKTKDGNNVCTDVFDITSILGGSYRMSFPMPSFLQQGVQTTKDAYASHSTRTRFERSCRSSSV